ncbi:NADH-quinone oxidoreductase subunit B family protein [Candidatus Bathyarchaeota archaeon]|nr:NADH-quinone oxidoreductase subunit B family protein [Candidatus Bathyarchaeota archaeon]MCK4668558.1 NADH-quinone oxidoreductase subunit B family protein [Candidatus Bathyarchaeota archaeon]
MNLFKWARTKSPWIIHFNTGGCNGCDIELVAAITPRFDLERFGILLKGSPRHADVLAVTGPVTLQVKDRLVRIYEQMPEPKYVIAIGTCAISGAPFQECYNVHGGIDIVLPVDVYVPGCPPKPEAIINGITKLIQKIRGSEGHGKGK